MKYFGTCVKLDAINTCGELVAFQLACKAQQLTFLLNFSKAFIAKRISKF
jgi:hypothetical protein